MATGETTPAKWLVSCAIDLLIDERLPILKTMLSGNDMFMLWAKPLLDNGVNQETLIAKTLAIDLPDVKVKIINYNPD